MTTIAYKDGVIAADGRTTRGDTVLSDNTDKSHAMHGGVMFTCGSAHISDELEKVPSLENGVEFFEYDWDGIFVKNGAVYLCGCCDDKIWMLKWVQDDGITIGSGGKHAQAALDLGFSPKEAVETAARRDTGTGGTIREWTIGDL